MPVLTVASLTPRELRRRLSGPGLDIRTGPFVVRVHSSIAAVVDNLALLYPDYPLDDSGFADFHVSVARARGLRRWIRPQVEFLVDGESMFSPLPLAQAFPIFEWGLNWCVSSRAHDHLVLHAAVVERSGMAAILPAPPGSGKSTLCAALVNNGWRLLSDELALVRLADGMLVPVPRPVSLKNASIGIVRDYIPGAVLSQAVHATSKGSVAHLRPTPDSIQRADALARPAWVIFPKFEAGADVQLEAVYGADTFMRLAENAFNYPVLGVAGFDALAGLVDGCAAYSFSYSRLDDALATFDTLAAGAP